MDIQGIVAENETLYITDPAIHSQLYKGQFGETNHGKIGILKFFESHECNEYCKDLFLQDPRKIKNDELYKIRAMHAGNVYCMKLYGYFEKMIQKWKSRISNFQPSILPSMIHMPIEETDSS